MTAAAACAAVIRSMSATVALREMPPDMFGKRVLGDSAGRPLPRGSATGPAWPIWAETAAPSAWTASVSVRSPGIASSVHRIWSGAVRPSGATAQ